MDPHSRQTVVVDGNRFEGTATEIAEQMREMSFHRDGSVGDYARWAARNAGLAVTATDDAGVCAELVEAMVDAGLATRPQ